MKLTAPCLLASLFAAATPALAAKGDVAAGAAKAETCQGCHGEKGISEIGSIPSLAGQTDNYLQWQLVFFRSGRRANEIMGPLSADLTDEDIRNLGAYYASLPPATTAIASDAGADLAQQGKTIVEQHHCSACHLDDFVGKAAAARLVHQHEEYLAKALADYRSSARPSVGVGAMTEAASGLSDDEIRAVAHYLATVQ
jgi:cytochrome c553